MKIMKTIKMTIENNKKDKNYKETVKIDVQRRETRDEGWKEGNTEREEKEEEL